VLRRATRSAQDPPFPASAFGGFIGGIGDGLPHVQGTQFNLPSTVGAVLGALIFCLATRERAFDADSGDVAISFDDAAPPSWWERDVSAKLATCCCAIDRCTPDLIWTDTYAYCHASPMAKLAIQRKRARLRHKETPLVRVVLE
jgi:hypothetical protein